jgi:hypothetical protein
LQTGCYVTTTTINEVANTGDYTLDSGIIRVTAWQWTNTTLVTVPARISVPDLLYLRANASASSPASSYAIAGSNLLMVFPTPDAADTVTLYYTPRPTVMSSGSHDPSNATYGGIPAEFHKAIELYALREGADYSKDGDMVKYDQMYLREIQKIRRYVDMKGGRKGRVLVNGTRRHVPDHRNDRY